MPSDSGRAVGLCLSIIMSCTASPAFAEVGASVSVFSDGQFRGQSISNGHPVAAIDLSYDDLSGFYLAGSAKIVITPASPQLLGAVANVGYAHTLPSGLTVDGGLVRSDYTSQYNGGARAHYTEIYAGIITKHISGRLHYSPDYFRPGVSTVYADLEASLKPAPGWGLSGHVGALVQLSGPRTPGAGRARYDWKLAVARRAGQFDLQLSWTGNGPDDRLYEYQAYRQSTITVGAVYVF